MLLSLSPTLASALVVPAPLIMPAPAVQQVVVPAQAASLTNAPASLLFPSTSAIAAQLTSLEDELEKAAQIQAAQDAKIDAQVRGMYTD